MVIQWDEPQELSGLVTVSSSTTIYLRPTVWTVNDVLSRSIPLELIRSIPFYDRDGSTP